MAKNKGKAKEELDITDVELDEDAAPAKAKKGKKGKVAEPEAPAKGNKKEKAAQEAKPKGRPPGREPLPEGYVSVEDLAKEYGREPRLIRQTLRDNEVQKPANGRWAWHAKKEASTLKQIRAILGQVGGSGKAAKKEEAPAKKAEAPKGKKGKEKEAPAPEEKKGKKKSK